MNLRHVEDVVIPRCFRQVSFVSILIDNLTNHILKLACQPLPGAGMNTRPRVGLDDLVVGITPRFREATSSRTPHRKSKLRFSVPGYVDNNCSGSLPALDRNCLCVVGVPSVQANASLPTRVYPARY
jgi:hypothetical protein